MTVAVLFARRDSCYKALSGVDVYDEDRNALTWPGGVPGVYHPPCRAWGQLSHLAKPVPGERELALWSVARAREWGGVVEHPKASRLWHEVGCLGFGIRDRFGGVLLPVYQCWWGHRAQKATCFYVVGPVPVLPFSRPVTVQSVASMGSAEREHTPPKLASWLVDLARSFSGWGSLGREALPVATRGARGSGQGVARACPI